MITCDLVIFYNTIFVHTKMYKTKICTTEKRLQTITDEDHIGNLARAVSNQGDIFLCPYSRGDTCEDWAGSHSKMEVARPKGREPRLLGIFGTVSNLPCQEIYIKHVYFNIIENHCGIFILYISSFVIFINHSLVGSNSKSIK